MDRTPKICFVVLAHHQPEVFHKLIDHLQSPRVDIVVHIDKRADLRLFDRPKQDNVHFMRQRRKVRWGGWSLTQTILDGLAHGLEVTGADYFTYLAGTDFPIRHPRALGEFLRQRYPANFLNYVPLVPGIWAFNLISRYRFMEIRARLLDARHGPDRALPRTRQKLLQGWLWFENWLNRRLPPRDTRWIRFYSGSSRWCLNRATVDYVVRHARSSDSRKLRRYLKASTNSDELFFQTVIFNSVHKRDCTGFDEEACREIFARGREPMPDEKRVYLHYIDWSPERENPAIMQLQDFDTLAACDKFFACKFLAPQSLPLIERLGKTLLS